MTENMTEDDKVAAANVAMANRVGGDPMIVPAVQATVDKRVDQYIQIRDELARRKKAYEESIEPLVNAQNILTGWMQKFLKDAGADSIKTSHGTCYSTTKYSASLEDAASFMAYVKANNAYELLDKKANVTACRDFVEKNGTQPPGVKLSSISTIGVRRK